MSWAKSQGKLSQMIDAAFSHTSIDRMLRQKGTDSSGLLLRLCACVQAVGLTSQAMESPRWESPEEAEETVHMEFITSPDQRGRMLTMETALPSLTLIPERAVIHEAVSEPFELQVDCISLYSALPLKSLVGEQMSLRLLQPDGSYRPWHGYVLQTMQLGNEGGLARYRLVVGPWLSFLRFRRDSVIFQDRTVLQIIDEIFKDYAQADYRIDVTLQPRPRRLCTQYAESDLEFVARLLAEEGLNYHFEHFDDDAAQSAERGHARHVLVIADHSTERAHLGDARLANRHASANLEGQTDSVIRFTMHRQVFPSAATLGSWDYEEISGVSGAKETALHVGEQPWLEQYNGSSADGFQDYGDARDAGARHPASPESNYNERFEGQGSTRHFAAGCRFALIEPPLFGPGTSVFNHPGVPRGVHQRPDNEFTLLRVEHHATNNLGSQAAGLLGITEIERGTYRNRFECVPAAATVLPRLVPKPTAPGPQVALVVGVRGEAATNDQVHCVKVRFPWQRAEAVDDRGFLHDDGGGAWVPVAESSARVNWGSSFLPRQGSEVIVDFVEGDIDRPVVVGQLYSGADVPPCIAGADSGVNHQGVVSGVHMHGLDEMGFNQWVVDDATCQLRMRTVSGYAVAEVGLGHLNQHDRTSPQRGAWRGAGFETSLREASGLVERTREAAGSASAVAPDGHAIDELMRSRDPAQSFARPWGLMKSPSTCTISTDTSVGLHGADNLSIPVQSDLQETVANSDLAASGGTTSLFTQREGAKLLAANGEVTAHADSDRPEILADQDVTVVSVDGEIRIQAKESVEIIVGEAKVLLQGGDITMTCPGTFKVAASMDGLLPSSPAPDSDSAGSAEVAI